MAVKVVTFDLDGVYFVNGKSNFINSLKELGVNEDEAKRVFLQSEQMNYEYKKGKMADDEFWGWAASQWGLQKDWKYLTQLLISGYEVDEEVVSVVRTLRRNGYKTAICTNNFPARINGLNEKFNFLDDFDVRVFSYEVGEVKPSRAIFEELVKRSDSEPSTIVYADDHEDNLGGAKDLGITAFLYTGFSDFMNKLRELGVQL